MKRGRANFWEARHETSEEKHILERRKSCSDFRERARLLSSLLG